MSDVLIPERLRELIGRSHYWATALSKETDRLRNRGRLIGNVVALITTATGAAIFTQLEQNPATSAKLIFGLASLLAAVLSGLQSYGAFSERATAAQNSSAQFGKVFGAMLDAQDRIKQGQNVPQTELKTLYDDYEQLRLTRPPVTRRVENQTKKELERESGF